VDGVSASEWMAMCVARGKKSNLCDWMCESHSDCSSISFDTISAAQRAFGQFSFHMLFCWICENGALLPVCRAIHNILTFANFWVKQRRDLWLHRRGWHHTGCPEGILCKACCTK
jgi:hypothetical protein